MAAILEEGARFSRDVLLPINQSGDEEGCVLEGGEVKAPQGFKEAYQQYVEGGWPSLAADYKRARWARVAAFACYGAFNDLRDQFSLGMYPGL